jgi:ubiquinone/menaquinone biosynthesis C-methylase UbiE
VSGVQASFDRIAEQYAADFADELACKPYDVERLRAFAARCPTGTVLDVGCGAAGHVGAFVSGLGPRVVGVDLSARSVTLAQRRQPRLQFVAADAHALPFASGACGGVVAFYSLIYAADPRPALVELRRVLQQGAPLLVAVHGGEGSQHFDSYKGLAVDVELHFRTPEPFAAQIRGAGFTVDALEVRPPYPFEHATPRVYVAARAA